VSTRGGRAAVRRRPQP